MEEFPSGQRGQTVNLLRFASMVRIRPPPPFKWAHSSAGRAPALQAGGHRFDPCCAHHKCGSVAQLVRVLACHARGRGFEPLLSRQIKTSTLVDVFCFYKKKVYKKGNVDFYITFYFLNLTLF